MKVKEEKGKVFKGKKITCKRKRNYVKFSSKIRQGEVEIKMVRQWIQLKQCPRLYSLALHKMGGGVLCACDADTREVEGGGPKVQGHPYLHGKLKANLGYMRPFLK